MTETTPVTDHLGPAAPTPPIRVAGGAAEAGVRFAGAVTVPSAVLEELTGAGIEVSVDAASCAEAGRDWWPLAMVWATEGRVPARPGAVVRPRDTAQVAAVAAACHRAGVPLTAAAGRSGVMGGSIPVFGGVVLDLTALTGIVSVDRTSGVVEVRPGTFGDHFEHRLRTEYSLTVGHWPQSMALSTVGGWVACRGAGQMSTRYGKIEDLVVGLEVVLADGSVVRTGGYPAEAAGPDLTELFTGSEGTLGIITRVWLRAAELPTHEERAAFAFPSFAAGMDAMRRILRRSATPAVLRLYDPVEADRNYQTGSEASVLLVLDEGDPVMVGATMVVVAEECAAGQAMDPALVGRWMEHRNDVSALEDLIGKGFVVDTMEVSAPWSRLSAVYEAVVTALRSTPGTIAASAHQSHSYPDGACLYFTFGGRRDSEDEREAYHREVWEAGQRAALDAGASISHHHGIGLARGRYLAEDGAHRVRQAIKDALDPAGILNPAKQGLTGPFGPSPFDTPAPVDTPAPADGPTSR